MRTRPALAILLLSLVLAAPAAAQAPQLPDIDLPNLPKPDDVARFRMTITGGQTTSLSFTFAPPAGACTEVTTGTISETWNYARGKAVIVKFRRYGKNVFMDREGRKLGDLAFGTTGTVIRNAEGSINRTGHPSCAFYKALYETPDCDKLFKVTRNMHFAYQRGVISVEGANQSSLPRNPAEACTYEHDVLSPEFPYTIPVKGRLPRQRIFGAKKGIKMELKGRSVPVLSTMPYTTIHDSRGNATLEFTLTRLPNKKR
jgi:hypothetical protein